MRDPEYGQDHRRNPGKNPEKDPAKRQGRASGRDHRRKKRDSGKTVLILLSSAVLVLAVLVPAVSFFPQLKSVLLQVGDPAVPENGLFQAGTSASLENGEVILPSGGAEKTRQGAEEEQTILIVRETGDQPAAEPESETEAPPKYTENENTRRIRRMHTQEGTEQEDITLCFAGDILFDDRYAVMASLLQRSGQTPAVENAFDDGLLSLMRGADVFMVNNEFPYSDRGSPLPEKKFTFRADPSYAELLTAMGADLAALANNHLYDYGEEALLDTLDTLDALKIPCTEADGSSAFLEGLPTVGAGRNLDEAAAPFYFTNGKIKIGFVCATQIERMGNPDTKGATESSPGVFRCLNSQNLVRVIRSMRSECDFIVAYLHWGTESTAQTDGFQRKLAQDAAQAGADLIIGDHPHVLQEIGLAEGVPVVYSLGNFLFNSGAQDTCLVMASLDPETAELKSLRFIPARQEGCRTTLLAGSEQTRVLEYMRSISEVSIDGNGYIEWEE